MNDHAEKKIEKVINSQELKIWLFSVILFFTAIFFVLLVFFLYRLVFNGDLSKSGPTWGEFGSYFGGVLSPLFSFMALIAVLVTILIQGYQMEISVLSFKKQINLIKIQDFENAYFQLVRSQIEVADRMCLELDDKVRGRRCYKYLYNNIYRKYYDEEKSNVLRKSENEIIENVNERFYSEWNNQTYIYFNNLFIIFDFIDGADFVDKKRYVKILSSQLSIYETALIFYVLIYSKTPKRYGALLDNNDFFKNFNVNILIDCDCHKSFYSSID